MLNQFNRSNVLSSLFWKLGERAGTQGIQFIVQILLARLLEPTQFGSIALVMVFISLANVFVQSGFNTALVQKKNASDTDFSSALYLSLSIAVVLYVLIFFSAPFISRFYGDGTLVPVLRVLSLTLFFGAFNSIQNAYVARKMIFQKLFISSMGANVISGMIGVGAAYMGFGIWALVLQQLTNQVIISVIMIFNIKWLPQLKFSFKSIEELFSFGSRILLSSLLNTVYLEIRTLIIGHTYSSLVLGYYSRGEQFPKVIGSNLDNSIQSVMLPTLSANQDDKVKLKNMVRRSIVTSSFIIFPIMLGMAVVAKPLVSIVLTDKWLPAVPFLQISCLSYTLMPIHTANLQAINAVGRSDIFLRVEILKKIVGVIILVITIPFGVYAIAWGAFISGIVSAFINAYPNKWALKYNYKEQMIDIFPSLLIACIMGFFVNLFNFTNYPNSVLLTIQIVSGIFIYISLAKLLKNESYQYLISIIKELRRGKNKLSDI